MKQNKHPESTPTVYTCGNCGTQITAESTKPSDAALDVCSNCHPAYTGKVLKDVSGSRVDAFNKRFKSE